MLCISHPNTDAWFNLAAEEFVLKNFDQDVFMLWQNDNAIVVGKHQNTLAEINYDFVKEQNIKVVRRLSGGGTVYHDMGNLNFTFIMNGHEGQMVDFRKFTQPIIDVLGKLGVEAKFEGRNDLTINGLKFSGNAEHVYKNRVLHHGTLLFSSELNNLTNALKVNPLKFQDKAVKSVRSRVTNISEHLQADLDVLGFKNLIMQHIVTMYPDAETYLFTGDDLDAISKLVSEKYSTWEWNFGYSPKYNFQKMIKTAGGFVEFQVKVEDGIIKDIRLFGDFFSSRDISELEALLINVAHREDAIRSKLSTINLNDYLHLVQLDEFVAGIF
ncbi:MAG TPA: lipoate--protein ligase [Bacteroidales bacterium]|nr:lipoate--protein ligase [Bacteroidales bacterium]